MAGKCEKAGGCQCKTRKVSVVDLVTKQFHDSGPSEYVPPKEGAMRSDRGKPRLAEVLAALDPDFLEGMLQVLEYGAKKYDWNNWQKGMDWTRVLNSMTRHSAALAKGEDFDEESGLAHEFHVAVNAMFMTYYKKEHKALDNRRGSHRNKSIDKLA